MRYNFKSNFFFAALGGLFALLTGGCSFSTYHTGHPGPGSVNAHTTYSSTTTVHHIHKSEPEGRKKAHHNGTFHKRDRRTSVDKHRDKSATRSHTANKRDRISRNDRFRENHQQRTREPRRRDNSHHDRHGAKEQKHRNGNDRNHAGNRSKDHSRDGNRPNRETRTDSRVQREKDHRRQRDGHTTRDSHVDKPRDRGRVPRVKKDPVKVRKNPGQRNPHVQDESCEEESANPGHSKKSKSRRPHRSR